MPFDATNHGYWLSQIHSGAGIKTVRVKDRSKPRRVPPERYTSLTTYQRLHGVTGNFRRDTSHFITPDDFRFSTNTHVCWSVGADSAMNNRSEAVMVCLAPTNILRPGVLPTEEEDKAAYCFPPVQKKLKPKNNPSLAIGPCPWGGRSLPFKGMTPPLERCSSAPGISRNAPHSQTSPGQDGLNIEVASNQVAKDHSYQAPNDDVPQSRLAMTFPASRCSSAPGMSRKASHRLAPASGLAPLHSTSGMNTPIGRCSTATGMSRTKAPQQATQSPGLGHSTQAMLRAELGRCSSAPGVSRKMSGTMPT